MSVYSRNRQIPCDVEAEFQRLEKIVESRDGHQKEFKQAFNEIFETLRPVLRAEPKYIKAFESLIEPERVVQFRVNWHDEAGQLHTNRGFRVQFNSAIGPYKGGLRFHPTVNLSILKFLGFEQIFKNSLTGLAMGGGKGGADFDPKGKSDLEVRNFCQAFMTELARHIGPDTDVPAGDIGVGGREIGFMYGQYKKMQNEHVGVLTGKGYNWGGSLCRPEATGYGAVYFAQHLLKDMGMSMEGQRCLVSGSGNAAQYTAEKLLHLGAKVLTVSDSNGVCYFRDGMTMEDLLKIRHLKDVERGRLSKLAQDEAFGDRMEYTEGAQPWKFAADVAFPAATQNEIGKAEAECLASNGVKAVIEVANMPSSSEAIEVYKTKKIAYAPGKASNAGGVAVSGMEMAQNASRRPWTFEETDKELQKVMEHIYIQCKAASQKYGVDLQAGANIAGFLKVADSMIAQGLL